MSIWHYGIINLDESTGIPIVNPTNPDLPNSGDSCISLQTTTTFCSPPTLGSVDATFGTGPECNLIGPLNIGFYKGSFADSTLINTRFTGYSYSNNTLEAGSYFFDVSGQLGTNLILPFSIDAEELAISGLYIELVSNPNDCVTPGVVDIHWDAGDSLYRFHYNDIFGASATGVHLEDVSPGDHEIVFSYGQCSKNVVFTMPYPTLKISVETTSIPCNATGNVGSALVSGQGGVPPYKFYWYNSNNEFLSTGELITGLGTGIYYVEAQDANHCELLSSQDSRRNIAITQGDSSFKTSLIFTSATKNIICCQEADVKTASLIIIPTGGTPPYTYLWNNGETGQYRTGLSAGEYSATVFDSAGCSIKTESQKISLVNDCTKFKWDFGNGDTKEFISPSTDLGNVLDTNYLVSGQYPVKVQIVDGAGRQGIDCELVPVPYCPPASGLGIFAPEPQPCAGQSGILTAFVIDENGGPVEGVDVTFYKNYLDTHLPPINGGNFVFAGNCFDADAGSGENPLNQPYPFNATGILPHGKVRTNRLGEANYALLVESCTKYLAIAKEEDNPKEILPFRLQSSKIWFYTCDRGGGGGGDNPPPDNPPPGDPGLPCPEETGDMANVVNVPADCLPPPPGNQGGGGDGGGTGGGGGGGGGPHKPHDGYYCDEHLDPGCCSRPGLNLSHTQLVACCVPQADGSSICVEGITEFECCEQGGTAQGLVGGLATCSGFGFIKFPDDPNYYCKVVHGACCDKDGCHDDNKHNCENPFGANGTFYPNKKCSDPAVNSSCYKNCCYFNVSTNRNECVPSTKLGCQDSVLLGGLGGRWDADCVECTCRERPAPDNCPGFSVFLKIKDGRRYCKCYCPLTEPGPALTPYLNSVGCFYYCNAVCDPVNCEMPNPDECGCIPTDPPPCDETLHSLTESSCPVCYCDESKVAASCVGSQDYHVVNDETGDCRCECSPESDCWHCTACQTPDYINCTCVDDPEPTPACISIDPDSHWDSNSCSCQCNSGCPPGYFREPGAPCSSSCIEWCHCLAIGDPCYDETIDCNCCNPE